MKSLILSFSCQSQDVLKEAIIIINKAASKGIIHKNTASRKISRLMKKVNSVLLVSVSNN
jgi:small subunit ribosomal protein S20